MSGIQDDKKNRFHFLDGLRAIASILVVIHHSLTAGITKALYGLHLNFLGDTFYYFTQSGVALFFVLSGVVLLRPYLRGQRKFKVVDYFYRRLKRIYPPFFVALIFGYVIICLIKNGPATYYSEIWRWVDTQPIEFCRQALILNFRGAYFNLAWWSLQIEVVFYILVPVAVFFFTIRKTMNYLSIFLVLICLAGLSLTLQFYLSINYPAIYSNERATLNIYRFIDYPVCFTLGIYLAKFDFEKYVGNIFLIAGIILIFFSKKYVPLINTGYGFLYAGFIIYAFKSRRLQSFLDTPVMIWLGERSYSLFLVHFSVFYFVDYVCSLFIPERNILYGVLTRMTGLPLALLCAMLLFNFVERKQARGLVTDKIFWPWQIKKLKKDFV